MNITGVNLNLLVAFDALLGERSVTRAARRVGVTQAAMSNSLAQLRLLFEDPLFLRRAHGVEPTSRALAIGTQVRHGLQHLEAALAPASFDPTESGHGFVVAMNDYCQQVVLPKLLARLAQVAPGVQLAVRHWGRHEVAEGLAQGELDLLLGFFPEVPDGYQADRLFTERFVCVVRRGHPHVGRRLSLKRYLSLRHVVVSEGGSEPAVVDKALMALGHTRHVGLRVSNAASVPFVVQETDLVAAVSERTALALEPALALRVLPLPVRLEPSQVKQTWHVRTDNDPRHQWLRRTLRDVCGCL